MRKTAKKILILGAGPTGLGAAYRLNELGEFDYKIIEKETYPGGLATSFVDTNGFTWDIGGHVQFSHYPYFDKVMDEAIKEEDWLNHQRESWVWIMNKFIAYPFQKNIHRLPEEIFEKCLKDLEKLNNEKSPELKNLKDWLKYSFGDELCNVFMYPYNFKVWAYPPQELNFEWIGERVALVDTDRLKKMKMKDLDDVSWGPNSTFRFPKYGGTGAIWKSVAEKLPPEYFIFKNEVSLIDLENKTVNSNDGEFSFDVLLSTLPLDILINHIKSPDKKIVQLSKKLKYSTSHIIGLGLKGRPREELKSKCWMYFPEDNAPFYRTTVFSNYSPHNVSDPKNQWSLMLETSESELKPVDSEKLLEQTIQGAINTNLMQNRSDIVSTWYYKADHGYPTPFLGRDTILNEINHYLESHSIFSRGRFGAWKYEVSNQDHSFMQGVEWVDRMLNDKEEITFNNPSKVNK